MHINNRVRITLFFLILGFLHFGGYVYLNIDSNNNVQVSAVEEETPTELYTSGYNEAKVLQILTYCDPAMPNSFAVELILHLYEYEWNGNMFVPVSSTSLVIFEARVFTNEGTNYTFWEISQVNGLDSLQEGFRECTSTTNLAQGFVGYYYESFEAQEEIYTAADAKNSLELALRQYAEKVGGRIVTD